MASLRVLAAMMFAFTLTTPVHGAGFQGLSANTIANAVSADGLVVVGQDNNAPTVGTAFRWTREGGMLHLGRGEALGVSGDGSFVVGWSRPGVEAIRWSSDGENLSLVPESNYSIARDVSGDGSVVVGLYDDNDGFYTGYFWDEVLIDIGFESTTNVHAVSTDGRFAVGTSDATGKATRFALFDSPDNSLGSLLENSFSTAYGVNADGSVIVGDSFHNAPRQAFRWMADDGMAGLGDLPGGDFASRALGVSDDGSVIIGWGTSSIGTEAMIWDEQYGTRDLRSVLMDSGLDLTGWTLTEARGMSADGRTIVGIGTNPNGATEGWVATIPEPSSCYLAAVSFPVLVIFAHRAFRISAPGAQM